jgi:hypothetical protein
VQHILKLLPRLLWSIEDKFLALHPWCTGEEFKDKFDAETGTNMEFAAKNFRESYMSQT